MNSDFENDINFNELDNIDESDDDNPKSKSKVPQIQNNIPKQGENSEDDNSNTNNSLFNPIEKDLIKAQTLKLTIRKYVEKFPQHLQIYGDRLDLLSLDQLSQEELEVLLKQIRVTIGSQNSGMYIKTAYFGTLGLIENMAPKFNLKLQGLQSVMSMNKQIENVLDEVSLEYESVCYIPPIQRLLLLTGFNIKYLHNMNREKELQETLLNDKLDSKLIDEFEDI